MTNKRPWMPLYVADYLADTGHLTTEMHGAYMLLIMHYWQHGGLPASDMQLACICRMTERAFKKNSAILGALFDSGWKHKRIDAELEKAADISEKRSRAALQMHDAKHANAHAEAHTLHTSHSHKKEIAPNGATKKGPDDDAWFESFWAHFPKKRAGNRQKAWRASIQARQRGSPDEILNGVLRYAASEEVVRGFAKGAEAWLNDDRWTCDYTPPTESTHDKPSANDRLARRQAAVAGILGVDFGEGDGPGYPMEPAAGGVDRPQPRSLTNGLARPASGHATGATEIYPPDTGDPSGDEDSPRWHQGRVGSAE